MKRINLGSIGFIIVLSLLFLFQASQPAAAQQAEQVDEQPVSVTGTDQSSIQVATNYFQTWQWPDSSPTQAEFGFGRISRASIPALIPPLPFDNPQVGPLIRPQAEGIETRSRAFTPKLTDGTETFEFPEDLGSDERWIRVDLTAQTVTAYEGETPLRSFLVSTGLPGFDTVTGEFRVRLKVSEQTMSGGEPGTPGYYSLPNVKWVMYFYGEYALHGSYWHDNFGNRMSHGCVNMTNADAKWLFDFAGPVWDEKQVWYKSTEENPGSRVIVHN